MGTSALVGCYTEHGWRAVRVHLDGYPHGLGAALVAATRLYGDDPVPVLSHLFSTRGWSSWPEHPHHPDDEEDLVFTHQNADDALVSWVYLFSLGDRRLDVVSHQHLFDVYPSWSVDLDGSDAPWPLPSLTTSDLVPVAHVFERSCPGHLVAGVGRLLHELDPDVGTVAFGWRSSGRTYRRFLVEDRLLLLDDATLSFTPPGPGLYCMRLWRGKQADDVPDPHTWFASRSALQTDLVEALGIEGPLRWEPLLERLWELGEGGALAVNAVDFTDVSVPLPDGPPPHRRGGAVCYDVVVGRRLYPGFLGVPVYSPGGPVAVARCLLERARQIGWQALLNEVVLQAPGGWVDLRAGRRISADRQVQHVTEGNVPAQVVWTLLVDPDVGTMSLRWLPDERDLPIATLDHEPDWLGGGLGSFFEPLGVVSAQPPSAVDAWVDACAARWRVDRSTVLTWVRTALAAHVPFGPGTHRLRAAPWATHLVRVRYGDVVLEVPNEVGLTAGAPPALPFGLVVDTNTDRVVSEPSVDHWGAERVEAMCELAVLALSTFVGSRDIEVSFHEPLREFECTRWFAVVPDDAVRDPERQVGVSALHDEGQEDFCVGDSKGVIQGAGLNVRWLATLLAWFGDDGGR